MAFQIGDWVALRPGVELTNTPSTSVSYSATGFILEFDGVDTYDVALVGGAAIIPEEPRRIPIGPSETVSVSASDLRVIGSLTRARSDAFGLTPEAPFFPS